MKGDVQKTKKKLKDFTINFLAGKYLLSISEHPKIHAIERSTTCSAAYSDKCFAQYYVYGLDLYLYSV